MRQGRNLPLRRSQLEKVRRLKFRMWFKYGLKAQKLQKQHALKAQKLQKQHALKGQKLLAQGIALGVYGRKPVAL